MIIERHLKPVLGKVKLAKLGPEAIRDYMNKKRAEGLSARTVQYHHAVLRAALGQAEADGKIARNPAKLKSAKPAPVERSEVRPLTPDQARVLLGAIAEDRLAPLYVAAIGLGLRQGELLGLSWDDLDLEVGTLTVRHTLQRYPSRDAQGNIVLKPNGKPSYSYHLDPPKTEKSRRTLGLPEGLAQLLRAHHRQQSEERLKAGPAWRGHEWDLVFCTESGEPLSSSQLTHGFQDLLASLELPRQRFHDLRHAAATFMLAQGVDLRVVMEVLGHSQIHVTANTYTHVKLDLSREAAERVDALLLSR
jgi:integrase